ncbi:phenylacetate-CoA oxygenase subunit PaaC [Nocardia farcinica]|uniref:1,2-phenylacetyl-CoA epoxidase subunit PaaC n=1 Tax=Nocardia farcinica TaxID=37329 RepID=UPI001894EBB8|nr:1,2-phenylacetyl-CoA epoxidase subunit PaaC [Nocardia farcinica]MBF6261379.1 phenylacetate-CoA oxygenase subunit PaaC [Nocardia farcinica]MBF6278952.1 phenylacetate-CoA oxygenase subunit PaaC [Nocardia farcinica]MBF6304390.1 phenylacetate-CoA oxygenase subunit PaaC [Nocardia farcinica]MBF6389431.1 phenylacetate-CoA oxygenase subunit PaaC [Nocardia farcinica]MBF6491562.1 phenylacetate-CoA oxygenase subunit PaaC [Nocardia farcinica]
MIDHDSAYSGLLDDDSDGQWAFGTSFDDPLAGVDTTVPADVDTSALAAYCLMLGDDALIAAQRLSEWAARAPELEEDVALLNIGLDLLGQARLLLARAGAADPAVVPSISATSPVPAEDALAFFRDDHAFRCVRLVEVDNGDFARTVVRLLVLSTWRLAVFDRLRDSRDPVLAAVADKGVKELTYHRDYAARWTVTLGCGTAESRRRMTEALAFVWPFVAELFVPSAEELALAETGVAVDPRAVRAEFDRVLAQVLHAAELPAPPSTSVGTVGGRAGRQGLHTEALGPLLTEMQCVARAHPEGTW